MVDRGGTAQLCPRYSCKNLYKNWYLHLHKSNDYQIWQAGTFRRVDSIENNQAGADDISMWRLRDKLKPLCLHYHSAVWPPNLAWWWLTLRDSFPWCHCTLWSRGRARSRETLKTLYLYYHSPHGNQTWNDCY